MTRRATSASRPYRKHEDEDRCGDRHPLGLEGGEKVGEDRGDGEGLEEGGEGGGDGQGVHGRRGGYSACARCGWGSIGVRGQSGAESSRRRQGADLMGGHPLSAYRICAYFLQ